MANKKISELTAHTDTSTLAAADYIPIVVGGVTKRIAIGILLDGLLKAAALQTAQPLSLTDGQLNVNDVNVLLSGGILKYPSPPGEDAVDGRTVYKGAANALFLSTED